MTSFLSCLKQSLVGFEHLIESKFRCEIISEPITTVKVNGSSEYEASDSEYTNQILRLKGGNKKRKRDTKKKVPPPKELWTYDENMLLRDSL